MTGKKETLYRFLKMGQTKHQKLSTSLLPICSKIFERIKYDNMLKYLLDNNLVSPKQSEFRSHYIFTSFDNGLEVRGVFLDMSKASDKTWHDGLIYKLKQNGIKKQAAMSFNRLFENSPTKSSFKWSVLIMDKGE